MQNTVKAGLAILGLAWLSSCVTTTEFIEEEVQPLPQYSRTLDMFTPSPDQACYDRATMPSTMVVDTHNHFRPFGGAAVPFEETVEFMEKTDVLFANVYGIGQSLPIGSGCEYYLDCIGTPALPSMKNDFANAANLQDYSPDKVILTLSMTFPDLARPETIPTQIAQLDRNYEGQFRWMGEVNLVKQALFGNFHRPTPLEAIERWEPFMAILRERNIPIAIHSDLGSDDQQTKYLYLFEEVLRLYPNNKIIWMHMGLSKELTTMPVETHTAIMKRLLDANPNLMLDISWRVVPDAYFNTPEKKLAYVKLFNTYPDRILTGTDFVALHTKTFD
ncbi:MAG: amidohydrolase family protein, partial [Pseudomonadota bacterium]